MIIYFENTEELIQIYEKTIKHSGGGMSGLLKPEYLESAIEHIKNDDYYPNFEDKLTHLFWSLNKNHIFRDGNKRIAITVCVMFLLKNGHLNISEKFLRNMESISYHVAAGSIGKQLLHRIITSFLFEDDYSEELKLELVNAFSKSGIT